MTPDEKPITKEELETKKLRLEIEDMERPFWKRPAHVLAALPTILILITLFVGFLNGFLQTHVTKLISENRDLTARRDELVKEYDAAKTKLDEQKAQGKSAEAQAQYQAMQTFKCQEELRKLKGEK